ncbi:MAG: NAD(P)/FAD-dependent oxidoreductase [Candidatus Nealsonbacteria bacterium]|nr:NAD(P)/FAD-dependent oxidoreductase [Candidatus Nealsonbacteria bacterium]
MKIAIIGAGINGLYLAWKLSERGHKAIVFEKKQRIGKQVCSGLFSERILEFIPKTNALIQNQIESVLIHFPKKTINVKFSKKFLVMSHIELDRLTAGLAQKSGAEIKLNCNIAMSDLNAFDRIIGCDGAKSMVRKSLNLPEPTHCSGIQGFVSEANFSNYVEVWPFKGGFSWKIPQGKETEYGIIESQKEAKLLFEEFLKENNLHLERINSAIVPQGLIIPSHSTITLCGDAAGLTKPWSGGGVIWGLIAAEILLLNFPDFLKYQKASTKFFLPKILFSKIATKMVYFLGFKFPRILPKNIRIESDFLM